MGAEAADAPPDGAGAARGAATVAVEDGGAAEAEAALAAGAGPRCPPEVAAEECGAKLGADEDSGAVADPASTVEADVRPGVGGSGCGRRSEAAIPATLDRRPPESSLSSGAAIGSLTLETEGRDEALSARRAWARRLLLALLLPVRDPASLPALERPELSDWGVGCPWARRLLRMDRNLSLQAFRCPLNVSRSLVQKFSLSLS